MNSFHFNMLFSTHAKTGKCYIVDGNMEINNEKGFGTATDCIIEDTDLPNIHSFTVRGYSKLDGDYRLYCDDCGNDNYKLTKKTKTIAEYEIHPANYQVSANRFKGDDDDPIWETLGYIQEENCTQKICTNCKEIKSCGNYDCSKNWICEECN